MPKYHLDTSLKPCLYMVIQSYIGNFKIFKVYECKINQICQLKPDIILFFFEFKGVGVFATKGFKPGAFLLQYPGELVSEKEAERREKLYKQQYKGCFMYYFTYENKTMW